MTNIYQIRAAIKLLHAKLRHPGGFPKMWWLYKVNNSATVDVIHTVQIWDEVTWVKIFLFETWKRSFITSGPSSSSVCYISWYMTAKNVSDVTATILIYNEVVSIFMGYYYIHPDYKY